MKMIALPNGSFVRSGAITAVSVLEERFCEITNHQFPNLIVVHHNGIQESVPVESLEQAKELAAEISRQCGEEESPKIKEWKDLAERMATVLVEVSQAKIFCAESMDIDSYATENVHRAISEYLQAVDKEEASV